MNGRHPLRTDATNTRAWMGSVGIGPAARWWCTTARLRTCSRCAPGGCCCGWDTGTVRALDGGSAAWQAAGGALTADVPMPTPVAITPPAPAMPTLDADAVLARLPALRLIDARAPERYRGDVEPIDRVAGGHIPGARNRFFKDNLQADGTFKPAAQLRAEYAPAARRRRAGDGGGVVRLQGITACHDVLAMEAAGLGTATLYPGSWSEWSSDPARPMNAGTV